MRYLRFALLPLLLGACADTNSPTPELPAPMFQFRCPGPDCGSMVLDQQSEIDASSNPIAIGSTSREILAQVVSSGHRGRLVALGLPVGCTVGQASELIIEIRDVVDGQPGSTVLLQVAVSTDELPAPPPADYRHISLGRGVLMSAGTAFAFVLSSPGECSSLQGLAGDPYPGGDGWFIADPNPRDVWERLSLGSNPADLPFQTFVQLVGGRP